MIDDVSDIQTYYDERAEGELIRLERHQLEHDITWRYLEKYLPKKGNVLEIGCGPGTITIGLAKRDYRVSAVDLSGKMIELALKRISEEGLKKNVLLYAKDARDLGEIKHNSFDAVLMMGPLYHLVIKEDRETALREAYSRLKPGGIIFSAFISRYGIWGDLIKNIPEVIEREKEVRSILDSGRDLESGPPDGIGFRAYFATIHEIGSVDPVIIETGMGYGPYGSVGVGEDIGTITSYMLHGAVYNAIGKWVDDAPITPDKVLKALGKT